MFGSDDFLLFVLVGLLAQLVDGALGMAYGVTCSSLLLALGAPPTLASASVHTAEVGTTALSGASHWYFGNVDKRLFAGLVATGVLGAALGAFVITRIDAAVLKPMIALYLIVIGSVVLWRVLRGNPPKAPDAASRRTGLLGFFAGFLDAVGGGGWGSINVTTLLARGLPPRMVIGSVNAAEFFVSLTVAALLWRVVGAEVLPVVAGLLVGGLVAAPIAAWVAKHVPARVASGVTASVVLVLSSVSLVQAAL